MSSGWDDDDWTGEPPEGRHGRERARPGYWDSQWQATVARGLVGLFVVAAIVLIVLAA